MLFWYFIVSKKFLRKLHINNCITQLHWILHVVCISKESGAHCPRIALSDCKQIAHIGLVFRSSEVTNSPNKVQQCQIPRLLVWQFSDVNPFINWWPHKPFLGPYVLYNDLTKWDFPKSYAKLGIQFKILLNIWQNFDESESWGSLLISSNSNEWSSWLVTLHWCIGGNGITQPVYYVLGLLGRKEK